MLVTIYQGTRPDDAKCLGDMHFETRPGEGDHLKIGNAFLVVQKAWHLPNRLFAGAKFAVLVSRSLAESRTVPESADDSIAGPSPVKRRA
ncbi:MAG: hypothetical protein ABI240_13255 [Sphingomonas sp.]